MQMAMAIDTPSPSPSASAAAAAGRRLGEEERWRRFGEEEDGWWGGQAAAGEGTGKKKNKPRDHSQCKPECPWSFGQRLSSIKPLINKVQNINDAY
uniref:Uncharacterized protein n=1 Tax=Oryza glaberrima TaxID=4538 RepID=I1QZ93_ORYGL